jgi:hypothetical protein
MTFLAALRHDRITAPWLVAEPINGDGCEPHRTHWLRSPGFWWEEGVDFGDHKMRIRISRAARRIAELGLAGQAGHLTPRRA